jgi:hypothetical protein
MNLGIADKIAVILWIVFTIDGSDRQLKLGFWAL